MYISLVALGRVLVAGRIAQLVEQLTLNQRVQGSNPCAPTNEIKDLAVAEPPTKHVFSLCGATMVPSWLRFPGTIVPPPKHDCDGELSIIG